MTAPHDQAERRRAGAPAIAVAAVTVAGLVLAALLLRPDGTAWTAARGPLTGNFFLAVLLAFGWLLGLTGLTSRYRAAVRGVQGLSPRAERLKDATRVLLPVLAVTVPIVLVVLASPGRVAQPPGNRNGSGPSPQPAGGPSAPPTPPVQHNKGGKGLSVDLVLLFEIGVGLLALAALVAGLTVLWRHRNNLWSVPAQAAAPEGADEEALAEAVESARRALHGDDARTAVIACYAAMEQSLAASGTAREASDSPTDLLARVVANGTLRDTDATELTELFREARYSSHPMGGAQLDRARAALDAIAATLAERALIAERIAGSEDAETSDASP
ncbi:hypothetical protein P3T36_002730 [Kitasatospora sp. MAP12-15]|uniref:DUF4129 domain-containing protein n=1 Tax=unclassified Kitasatospora TaxID=2633591 RepID=UPI0024765F2C|nr:DUF4129 domain-containing protein [Kitasatospora sp. MAP12-44]MDH6113909.1 hypothetical protein [Kitasatospora sp. MAP12-44]